MELPWKKKSSTLGVGFKNKTKLINPQVYIEDKEEDSFSFGVGDLILPLWIAAIGLLCWFFFLSPFFKVKYIFVQNDISPQVSSILKKLKGKNIFLLRPSAFIDELEKKEPIIKQITLIKGIPDTLRLRVEERNYVLAWSSQGEIYLLDKEGVIFLKPEVTDIPQLVPVIDKRGLKVELGQKVVSPYFVEFARRLLEEVPFRTNQKIKSLAIDETTFTIEATLESNIRVIFDINTSLDNQISALTQVLANNQSELKEYADVRVEGKVFFK